jgi:hypothetical protein
MALPEAVGPRGVSINNGAQFTNDPNVLVLRSLARVRDRP